MRTFFLALLILFLSTSFAEANILVANADGAQSAAASWLVGKSYQMPDSYSSTTYLNVDSGSTQYTPYFTPVAGDEWAGVLVYVYYVSSTTTPSNITATLMEGAVERATAVITYQGTNNAGYGPCVGWVFHKAATPYAYGNTDVNTWRVKFTSSTAADIYFRAVTTTMAYVEVTSDTAAPGAGDTLFVCGNGTVAGTFNTVTVTIDEDRTLGSAGLPAIGIGKGGTYTWGDAQTDSFTLTCAGSIYFTGGTLSIGTSGHILTKDYIQSFIFDMDSTLQYGLYLGDQASGPSTRNYTSPTLNIYGNYQFNQASEARYKDTLASDCGIGGTSLVFTNDVGLRAGGGDILLLGSTTTVRDAELVTTTAYNAGTKTATIGATTYAHATGGVVYVMSCNAVITSDNSAYNTFIRSYGGTSFATANIPHIGISYLEGKYLAGLMSAGDSTSSVSYLRVQAVMASGGTADTYFGILHDTFDKSVFVTTGTSPCIAIRATDTRFTNCYFANATGLAGRYLYSTNDLRSMTDCVLDGMYIFLSGNKHTYTRVNITASEFAGAFSFSTTNIFKHIYTDCNEGNPVAGAADSLEVTSGYIADAFFNNLSMTATDFISLTTLDDTLAGTCLRFQKFDGGADDHRVYKAEGYLRTTGAGLGDTTTKTAGELSLGFVPFQTSLITNSTDNLHYEITKAVAADSTVVWYGYMRKNANYGSATRPTVTLTSADGNISDTATMTDVDNTWEIFTVSGTVGAADTYITLRFDAESANASAACYFADMQLVIGNATSGTATGFKVATLWKDGEPTADETLGGTVDATFLENAVWDATKTAHTTAGTMGKSLQDTEVKVDDAAVNSY